MAKRKYDHKKLFTPINTMLAGVFLSAAAMFMPIYWELFAGDLGCGVKTLLVSAHNAVRLFMLGCDFELIVSALLTAPGWEGHWYPVLAAVLYVLAPILTFGFILSFFKNISAYMQYMGHWRSDAYVFSELNEKALSLALSIRETHPRAVILFADAYAGKNKENSELIEQAQRAGALCFKKDVLSFNLDLHSKRAELSLFVLSEDSEKSMEQTLGLMGLYKNRAHTHLYLFSSDVESELLVNGTQRGKIKIRRINEARSLINWMLYENGEEIFESAADMGDGRKRISVLIVGLGKLGSEMLRTLTWFCQMDSYEVRLNAVDADPAAKSRFAASCPALMSEKYNGVCAEGEAQYRIDVHAGVDAETEEFEKLIHELETPTFVVVALGSDELNISTAVKLRMLFERKGEKPVVRAVVQSNAKCEALKNARNFRGAAYDIILMGDLRSSYSEKVIIDSALEEDALARHLKYSDDEEDFWAYEYNYRSSLAAAIHRKIRLACGIPGADKSNEELTEQEREIIESLEHRRWNAYMLSEGYVFSGTTQRESRNDLAKMHPDLVPFSQLSEEEKRKDSRLGTK
ncbi:MAG: hypothetical protein Q4C22_03295 [Bacillota bacterium]|nr:hypothetical protein [Bacillota bacterium]